MKFFLVIAFNILLISSVQSQSVILSSANCYTNKTISISYALGDVFVGSFNNGKYILDQGFTSIDILDYQSSVLEEKTFIELQAYPNPVTDFLSLNIAQNIEGFSYKIYDFTGRLVTAHYIVENLTLIDFTTYATAIYLLQVSNGNNIIKSFTIIKK